MRTKIVAILMSLIFMTSPIFGGTIVTYNNSYGKNVKIVKTWKQGIVKYPFRVTETSWEFNGGCIQYVEYVFEGALSVEYKDDVVISRNFSRELVERNVLSETCLF